MDTYNKQIPSPEKFCFETPLYSKFPITIDNYQSIHQLESYEGPHKYYCPECNQDTVYKAEFSKALEIDNGSGVVLLGKRIPKIESDEAKLRQKELQFAIAAQSRNIEIELVCSMDKSHKIIFQFYINKEKIMKIGQYPSVYDLESNQLKKYKGSLKNYYEELSKAIKLNSSGIGIGSYVYLRRIFERLVFETFQANINLFGGISHNDFMNKDMKERIKMLKDFLPPFLSDNTILYGILSKGVHELNEEECLNYFDLMKECIFLILEQKIEEESKKAESKKLQAALQKAGKDISSK